MNSKVKSIIICVVVIICLGVTLLVLNLTGNKDDSTSSSDISPSVVDSVETIPLINDIADDLDNTYVKAVKVRNENDSFTVSQIKNKTNEWEIKALDGIEQSSIAYSGMTSVIASLSATDIAEENAEDLLKYGLKKAKAEFTVTFSDDNNTKRTYLIGDIAPNEDDYYVCEKGKNTVYTVASGVLSYFFYTKEDFIALTMLEKPLSDSDYPDFIRETITSKSLDYDMVIENPKVHRANMLSAQVMTEPVYAYLDATNSAEITHGMWGLSANSAVLAKPDEKDFKTYGLLNPTTKVKLETSAGTYTLYIGDPVYAKDSKGKDTTTVEFYYTYLDGVSGKDVIFKVLADSLPWAGAEPSDFISSLMTYNAATDLKSVSVDDGKEKNVFKLKAEIDPDAQVIEGEDPEMMLTSVKLNGKELNLDVWKSWYQVLLQCPTSEVYFKDPETKCYLTVSINRNDGGGDVLQFYKDTARRTIVKLNGKTSYRIKTSYVNKLVSDMQRAIEGKEIQTN